MSATLEITGRGGGLTGGGGSTQPVESPNTLRALTIYSAVDLLGEGPCKGLVNGAESVFFNGTALANNTTRQLNFTDTTVDIRLGYPDQGAMAGFPDVEATVGVGAEVKQDNPIVVTINDLNASQVRVTLQVPALFATNLQSGDVGPFYINATISVQQVDGPWIPYGAQKIGKTRSTYAWDTLIPLPGVGPWNLRVHKDQPDDTDSSTTSTLIFSAYTTIIQKSYTYADSFVAGVVTNAATFGGSVPTRTYLIDALLCKIPSNYNPYTRTYTGLWDGTFKTDWTCNNAWVLYNIIVNDRWGLGRFIGVFTPDKMSFYNIGQYCDGIVPDGFGGNEHRYSFHGSIPATVGSREQAWKVLQSVAATFHGMVFYSGGVIWVAADMPKTPVGPLVTRTNVIDGRFTYAGIALKARHFQALCTWRDPLQQYTAQVELVQDLTTDTWNQTEVQLNGCCSRGEAHRYGKWILDTEKNATQTVTYSASWDHCRVRPGDIVPVADSMWAGLRAGGRLKTITASGSPPVVTAVQLDASYDFQIGKTYEISVVMPSGKVEIQNVTNLAGLTDVVTIGASFSVVPLVGCVFIITGDVEPQQFYVLAVKETAPNIFEITGLQHDPTKFDRIELGINLKPPIYTVLSNLPPKPPVGIFANEHVFSFGGAARSTVIVSWGGPSDARVQSFEVQLFDTAWRAAGFTGALSLDINDLDAGIYQFQVRSVDQLGRKSQWVGTGDIHLLGLLEAPDDIQNFQVSILGETAVFTWNPCQTPNLGSYRIRWSPIVGSVAWSSCQLIADNIQNASFSTPTQAGTYMVKAVTLQGVESINPAVIESTITSNLLANIVQTYTESPEFTGTKVNVDAIGTALQLSSLDKMSSWTTLASVGTMSFYTIGFSPSGEYLFAETLDLGDVYTSRITSIIQVFGNRITDVLATWVTLASQTNMAGADVASWSCTLMYRVTNDDPGGSPVWTSWFPLITTYATFRAIQFKLVLTSSDPTITPTVPQLGVTVDMPDRDIAGLNVDCPPGGISIVFDPSLKFLKAVLITGKNMQQGDYWTIPAKSTNGFTVEFWNASNVSVDRNFDYHALGYGKGT